MKAVIQRVKWARVLVEDGILAHISKGILVLLCVEKGDNEKTIDWMVDKLLNLRIFPDDEGKLNRSIKDVGGEILLVSNFTVCGELKKGTRPSFHLAEEPSKAQNILEEMRRRLADRGVSVKTGLFGAHMEVELLNDGPVTLVLDRSLD
ncbi:MAG: D-aminoacyl-tRNA deacylase [Caldimicrobium sp.]|nr:D-aminoacyl-tRNA deacylase [Caldimicrobium sp.]MCX7614076.1 D-aminoacyl-tRNA deacylase [Caldimicrobium sp.]MDW8182845.1 D-aminoacyl-tRNA deacylase [Caldimicrobium sp.]